MNTRFFHASVKDINVMNVIVKLVDEEVIVLDNPELVMSEIVGYYKQLLGSSVA